MTMEQRTGIIVAAEFPDSRLFRNLSDKRARGLVRSKKYTGGKEYIINENRIRSRSIVIPVLSYILPFFACHSAA